MIRNEVQRLTGLTRKAIEYYEEKELVVPRKHENGYREYTADDVSKLNKISLFRKLDLSLIEIKEILSGDSTGIHNILRRKQLETEFIQKKLLLLERVVNGTDIACISEELAVLEKSETILERLLNAFPGYFGYMFFLAYLPFFDEPVKAEKESVYYEFIEFLDGLPPFKLSEEEIAYIEEQVSLYDLEAMQKINASKIQAVENIEEWLIDNKEFVEQYEAFKKSDQYLDSTIKKIQDKLQQYMLETHYYERAIPLLRAFSESYNAYYEKLVAADKKYFKDRVNKITSK